MTEYERKFEVGMVELWDKGIWVRDYMPPLLRAQRALGMKVRPIAYTSFWLLALIYGTPFGIGWALVLWFFRWWIPEMPLYVVAGVSVISGVLFGLGMASTQWRAARKLGLSRWRDL